MSHNTHEQFPTPRSSGQQSGGARAAPKRWATAATLLTLGLAPVAQAAEGDLDPTFGVNSDNVLLCDAAGGVMTCDVAGAADQLFGMATLLPDGKIVVGGRAGGALDPRGDFVVARFHKNGSLDTTFGVGGPDGLDGLETTDVSQSNALDQVTDLVLQDHDGQRKIVLVGSSGPNGSGKFAVVRYTADGKLDSGFDTDGIAMPPFPGPSTASAVAIQPSDGKIVVAIRQDTPTGGDFVLARFTPQGQLDTSFGEDGFVQTSFPKSQRETTSAVVVQLDGKIVAGGRAGPDDQGSLVDFALARYNRDGSLDDGGPDDTTPADTFGTNGRVRTDFERGGAEGVAALVRQPDGKIVAGGNSTRDAKPGIYPCALRGEWQSRPELRHAGDRDDAFSGGARLNECADRAAGRQARGGRAVQAGFWRRARRFRARPLSAERA